MFQHLLSALSMRRPDSGQKQPVGKENAEPWGDWADLPEEADAKLGCSGWMGRMWMPWGAERICWRWHGTGRAPEVGASWAGAHRDGRLTGGTGPNQVAGGQDHASFLNLVMPVSTQAWAQRRSGSDCSLNK